MWLCGCVAVAVAVCPFLRLICCFTCVLSYQATLPQQIGLRRCSVSCSAKPRRRLLLCVATRPSGTLWKRMFSTASQPNSTLRRPPKPAHASCNMWRAAHRFTPAVKTLQGLVWEGGYRSGSIKGALFDDVPAALKALHAQGARVYLFSSGSSLAQALVFKHSKHGDLSAYISGYIDTTLGWVLLRLVLCDHGMLATNVGTLVSVRRSKQSSTTYRAILGIVGATSGSDVIFASDSVAELDAARAVGITTVLAERPGNVPVDAGAAANHERASTFEHVFWAPNGDQKKRRTAE